MKQRIKVVLGSDAALDGQAVRAWLQYDTKTEKTIKECRRTFAKQLGLHDADTVELIIEGESLMLAVRTEACLTWFNRVCCLG